MFASLSTLLHDSHVKLARNVFSSTSISSKAGLMEAFCPLRLFNIKKCARVCGGGGVFNFFVSPGPPPGPVRLPGQKFFHQEKFSPFRGFQIFFSLNLTQTLSPDIFGLSPPDIFVVSLKTNPNLFPNK